MINSYFSQVYLINLDRRIDRLERVSEECKQHGIKFKRVKAIDGYAFDDYKKYDEITSEKMRWNSRSAALVKTTQLILEDAMLNKYDRILILEDDVQFNPLLNKIFAESIHEVPKDWETLYFGLIHQKPFQMISNTVARVTSGYCCHCYGINSNLFAYLHSLISKMEKPIDQYTLDDIQTRGRSYCFVPNLAYQVTGHSDIDEKCIQHSYLKIDYKKYFNIPV